LIKAAAGAGVAERQRQSGSEGAPIQVRFWGTRGSLSAPLGHDAVRGKVREALLAACRHGLSDPAEVDGFIDRTLPFSVRGTFGGNTSCVEIGSGGDDEYLLCDLGTGVREFGNRVLAQHGPARPHSFNVFLSHTHWDHIMGFPFFAPAYIPGNRIRIHGCHKTLREAMLRQQSPPCFPVPFAALGATIEFVELEPGVEYQVGGFTVSAIRQFHEGESFGYRFSRGGRSIVYSTDCEHKASVLDQSYPFVSFFRDADLLIFDAMYSLAEAVSVKEDWGHSSNILAVELAQLARVKQLVLFHHEPAYDDATVERVLRETARYEEISRDGHRVEVVSAYDGLELAV
jgi:phosphoribosyl 1,2-cyclic phosphodiesterase